MNCYRHNSCNSNIGNCPSQVTCPNQNQRNKSWMCKIIKPLFSFIVSVLLALSMNHLSDKYSTNGSLQDIKNDLSTLRNSLNKLSNEVKSIQESKDDINSKLKDVSCVVPKLSDAIAQLRNEISEESISSGIREGIRRIVKHEIDTYDADKTGRPDYALESSGGSILCTRDTEPYSEDEPSFSLLGIPFCAKVNTPNAIIQPTVFPGECWAFKGTKGRVVIKLMSEIIVTGFTLEHISASISPTSETTSAPKEFSVLGLINPDDKNGHILGEYTYNNKGPSIQYFPVQNRCSKAYGIVELQIRSNSGNPNFTCIYRLRVHGEPTQK